ncbi:MAG: DUF2442 domain-containing protein [Acidobacteria bacterium]|nr:DUF2442 domain-containing protein [Acidobacteriota bacterium]
MRSWAICRFSRTRPPGERVASTAEARTDTSTGSAQSRVNCLRGRDGSCSDDALTVVLDDGRSVSVPLEWFPRLVAATPRQRRQWEPIGGGIGIHWEAIDEDISVASLLRPERFMRLAEAGLESRSTRPARRAAGRKSTRARRA